MLDYYTSFCKEYDDLSEPRNYCFTETVFMPELPDPLYLQAKSFGGVALFCISRFSGESNTKERTGEPGDFQLSEAEKALLDRLSKDFEKIIVILNACGPVSTRQFRDNPKVGAIVYPMYGGGTAGEVLCDLLLGNRYPSGHLQDTFADWIEDYPSTATYTEHLDYVNYEEDIFVGYRYFETFAPEKAIYPFGFGLSYTSFRVTCTRATRTKDTVKLTALATNTGNFPGKEVCRPISPLPRENWERPQRS